MGRRIGEILLSEGRITERTLSRALELQQGGGRGTRLGGILLKWEMLRESELLDALSQLHRCPAVDWSTLSSAAPETVRLLSPAQAARLGAVPYAEEKDGVRVAFVNPSNLAAVDEVQSITGRRVRPAVTTEVRMMQAQQRYYARPLAREAWSVIQKLERRRAPAETAPSGGAARNSRERSPAASGSEQRPDFSAIAESLLPMIETWEAAPPRSGVAEPDPLRDDRPLANFVGDALEYYEGRMNLRAALASLEVEDVEDAGEAAVERTDESSDLESTQPSRRTKREPDAGLSS